MKTYVVERVRNGSHSSYGSVVFVRNDVVVYIYLGSMRLLIRSLGRSLFLDRCLSIAFGPPPENSSR